MESEKELRSQIEALENQIKPLKEKLNAIWKKKHEDVEAKLKRCHAGKDKFSLDELRFSASARCACGAGFAYPKNTGMRGSWDCSDILTGNAIPSGQPGSKTHDGPMPFSFYEIKSEDQPSAKGMTTRPKQ